MGKADILTVESLSTKVWSILNALGWQNKWHHNISHVNLSQFDEGRANKQRKLIDAESLRLLDHLVGTPEKAQKIVQLKILIKPAVATASKYILGHDDLRIYIPTDFRYKIEIDEPDEKYNDSCEGSLRLWNESFPEVSRITSSTSNNMNTAFPNDTSENVTAMKIISVVADSDVENVEALLEKVNRLTVGFKDYNSCTGKYLQYAKFVVISNNTDYKELIESQGISFLSLNDLNFT